MLSAQAVQKAVMSSAWLATTIRRTSTEPPVLPAGRPWEGVAVEHDRGVALIRFRGGPVEVGLA